MSTKPSEHFSLAEISCRCNCGQALVDQKLYPILENFRRFVWLETGYEVPFVTHCVNRCVAHNNKFLSQGASTTSLHLVGRAWDGHGKGISLRKIRKLAKKAYKLGIISGGLGLYKWGIHIDSGRKRTWKGDNYVEEN